MLKLVVPGNEQFNEETQEFVVSPEIHLELEHSLLAISKWESKFTKPFLSQKEKEAEEILEYVCCMLVSPEISSTTVNRFTRANLETINTYINSPQSATTFAELPTRGGKGETITSELIYYWMVTFNIPFECQTWHINRLFSLIRICNVKNSKQKKMPRHELAARNRELNAKRRAELNTSG